MTKKKKKKEHILVLIGPNNIITINHKITIGLCHSSDKRNQNSEGVMHWTAEEKNLYIPAEQIYNVSRIMCVYLGWVADSLPVFLTPLSLHKGRK